MVVEDADQDHSGDRTDSQGNACRTAHRSQIFMAFVVEINHRRLDTEYSGSSATL
jgi:hypothetical protein